MEGINEIIDGFSFRDEIAKATEFKEEITSNPLVNNALNELGLEESDRSGIERRVERQQPEIAPEIEEYYDAETNATALVNTLTAIDSLVLSIVVQIKCRRNAGGNKNIKKMKAVRLKQIEGKELDENEQFLKAKFEEFKADISLLSGEVIPNQTEIDRLIQTAIPYCESTKFKMGSGSAFWIGYAGSLTQRIVKIMGS